MSLLKTSLFLTHFYPPQSPKTPPPPPLLLLLLLLLLFQPLYYLFLHTLQFLMALKMSRNYQTPTPPNHLCPLYLIFIALFVSGSNPTNLLPSP
ncbi:MAG: hypothetical protein K6253_00590 [Candidatus Liberibacter asiaticus]|nr:hypothetical protein [Candidatus Liberibacter asiaticus]